MSVREDFILKNGNVLIFIVFIIEPLTGCTINVDNQILRWERHKKIFLMKLYETKKYMAITS